MKLKYILAAGVVALLAGCDESRFLDTKPQGTLNDDLLSSAEGVELLVTSAYAGLKGPNRDMHWVPMTNWTYGEVRSDNAYKGGGGVNDVQSPNQKIPDRKTKCVIKTHINIKQNVIFGAKLKPV